MNRWNKLPVLTGCPCVDHLQEVLHHLDGEVWHQDRGQGTPAGQGLERGNQGPEDRAEPLDEGLVSPDLSVRAAEDDVGVGLPGPELGHQTRDALLPRHP